MKSLILKSIQQTFKWLLIFSYKTILSDLPKHLNVKDKAVEFCSKPYGNISLAGDLNAKISDTRLDAF